MTSFISTMFPSIVKKSGKFTAVVAPDEAGDGFEFANSWPGTVDPIPSPTFASPDFTANEDFDLGSNWSDTVSLPAPTWNPPDGYANENFDGYWEGT